jgi:uncharacterized protein (TIRG00374 family)
MTSMERTTKRNWRLIVTIVTFIAMGALVYASRRQILDTVQNLRHVNAWALLLMLPFQALNYHAYAKLYQGLFAILGQKITYRFMLRTAAELNFVNSVFPSGGISGFSYFGLRMRAMGMNTGRATLIQIMRFVLVFISFQALIFAGLWALAIEGQASHLTILVAGSLATLLAVMTFAAGFIIGSKRRIKGFFTFLTRVLNRLIQVVRPKNPETINIAKAQGVFTDLHENYNQLKSKYAEVRWPLFYALLANIAEILTIYAVYMAFDIYVNPGAVIIAYAIANFAGFVSVLPGGVGLYEVLMTAVLATAGVPPHISIPVTVMYRILNMLIQLPAGYYFYHKTVANAGKDG